MLLLHGGSSGPCGQESVQGCMGAKEEAGSMYFLGCYHPLSIYAWLLTHSCSQTLCRELRKESKGGNQEFKVLTSHRAGRGCLQKFFLLIQLFRELGHICDPHWIEWQRFSKSPRQLSHEDGGEVQIYLLKSPVECSTNPIYWNPVGSSHQTSWLAWIEDSPISLESL